MEHIIGRIYGTHNRMDISSHVCVFNVLYDIHMIVIGQKENIFTTFIVFTNIYIRVYNRLLYIQILPF